MTNWLWGPFFTPEELACTETGELDMFRPFMERLCSLRAQCGFPFIINSGYRSIAHSVERVKDSAGPHAYGRAVDIRVYGSRAHKLIKHAGAFGFTGIGIAQDLAAPLNRRYIHLDDMEATSARPRPWVWSYPYKG